LLGVESAFAELASFRPVYFTVSPSAGIILNPTRFGLRVSDEDVANYVYFWRCCGYQLGIADEYNLCGRSALTARHIVSQIEDQIVLPDIHNKPPQWVRSLLLVVVGQSWVAASHHPAYVGSYVVWV